jgi:hypothetical protein
MEAGKTMSGTGMMLLTDSLNDKELPQSCFKLGVQNLVTNSPPSMTRNASSFACTLPPPAWALLHRPEKESALT